MRIGSTTERPVRLHMVRANNEDLFVVDAEGRVWVKTPGFRAPPPEHGWRVQAKDVDAAILAGLAPFTIVARLRGRETARELAGVADRLAGGAMAPAPDFGADEGDAARPDRDGE